MMQRRSAVVVVVGGLGSLACGGLTGGVLCPSEVVAGERCWPDEQVCLIDGQEDDCGLNGHECRDGEWRERMTYCNPPPPPPSAQEPEPAPSAGAEE